MSMMSDEQYAEVIRRYHEALRRVINRYQKSPVTGQVFIDMETSSATEAMPDGYYDVKYVFLDDVWSHSPTCGHERRVGQMVDEEDNCALDICLDCKSMVEPEWVLTRDGRVLTAERWYDEY